MMGHGPHMPQGVHHDVNGSNEMKVAYHVNLYETMRYKMLMLLFSKYIQYTSHFC